MRIRERLSVFLSPVGTGNTRLITPPKSLISVHPRGYGEHFHTPLRSVIAGGSSPWVRGTQLANSKVVHVPRFIPVGTGNTECLT